MLSREFEELICLADSGNDLPYREAFPTHRIIILDEPTATIDPVEETKIYN